MITERKPVAEAWLLVPAEMRLAQVVQAPAAPEMPVAKFKQGIPEVKDARL